MRIRKYDFDYGRRVMMEKTLRGIAGTGVLAPVWPLVGNTADVSKAYPDELLSIDTYTKGKIKPGDVITAANVEVVKDLLDPIAYDQVRNMGRRIHIVQSQQDVTKMFPHEYLEATLRNTGRAKTRADGNIWTDGDPTKPWIGGNPFPDPKNGFEAVANITLAWGRHSYSQYAIRDWDISPSGENSYQYDFVWAELNVTARPDGTVFQDRKDLLRLNSIWFTAPNYTKGSSFLNTWYYDQRKFPDLHGYFPAFKRVRQFPTNQRFEPLVPGITLFLSDGWGSGDPLLTWGNYRIVGRQPFLASVSSKNFMGGYHENWERPVHGGAKGQTFFDTYAELVPEVLVIEADPVGYPRAPVSRRRIWIDVRNSMFVAYVTFDRRGKVWKSVEPAYAQYSNDRQTVLDGKHPAWSFTHVQIFDAQVKRMSRFVQARQIAGGYTSKWSEKGEDVYNRYLTTLAIQRLGT
ncbi:MAG: DUF1329 domain-containing protein [Panacagrimonas sp.]